MGTKTVVENGDFHFAAATDNAYIDAQNAVEIIDPALRRRIRLEKQGSLTTVVWNPWQAKARAMADFGDDEYQGMVCVESGNVGDNKLMLAPGQRSALEVVLSSKSWI